MIINELLYHHIAALKMNEKAAAAARAERDKWRSRVDLARNKGEAELAAQAEKKAAEYEEKTAALEAEAADIKKEIETLKRDAPAAAARERSADPDLLEQELLIANGHLPGDEDKVAAERTFADLEKAQHVEEALAALKAKAYPKETT